MVSVRLIRVSDFGFGIVLKLFMVVFVEFSIELVVKIWKLKILFLLVRNEMVLFCELNRLFVVIWVKILFNS